MWPHIEIFPVMFIDAQHGPTMPILLGCLLSLLSTWVHIKRRDATQIYLDLISLVTYVAPKTCLHHRAVDTITKKY